MDGFDHILNWKLKVGSHRFPGKDGGTCINEAALVAAGVAVESCARAGIAITAPSIRPAKTGGIFRFKACVRALVQRGGCSVARGVRSGRAGLSKREASDPMGVRIRSSAGVTVCNAAVTMQRPDFGQSDARHCGRSSTGRQGGRTARFSGSSRVSRSGVC